MEKTLFTNILKELNDELKKNKSKIDKALNEEYSKGMPTSFSKIEKIINEYQKVEKFKSEGKKIAVCYDGRPEITLTYILDSMVFNNNITYCLNGNKKINSVLIEVVQNSFLNCRIKNEWINYDEKYNEIYLRDTEKFFDKLVYIGDYFEYERFCLFFKKPVEYNNYGYIKLYIDSKKHNDLYKKIMEYSYKENIYLEVYNDIRDFILESKKTDFAVLFLDDSKLLNKAQKMIKASELIINSFPFDEYKFKVIR